MCCLRAGEGGRQDVLRGRAGMPTRVGDDGESWTGRAARSAGGRRYQLISVCMQRWFNGRVESSWEL